MARCTSCGATGRVERGALPYELTLETKGREGGSKGRKFLGDVEGERCVACGETFYDASSLEHFDELVARWLVENGFESGAELRFVRKAAGLRAADLAELLGVSLQTVSSWENGKHPADATTRGTIGALALDAFEGSTVTRDRLRAMRTPLRKAHVRFPKSRSPAAE